MKPSITKRICKLFVFAVTVTAGSVFPEEESTPSPSDPSAVSLTVKSGKPSGRYAAGTPVTVKADAPPHGTHFTGWTGDVQILADPRDFAGTNSFPALDPETSFPYHPFVPEELPRKVPEWLNDVTLYHNRGDTTFTGAEDPLYGDFAGLDDLFTEHPRVVQGMIDIYKTWVRDFRIDGFRIDTMKHVNDEFWQQFGPEVLKFARRQGLEEFFMFGEVFDLEVKAFTARYTTRAKMQSVLDFAFQARAQDFAANSGPTARLQRFFEDDDLYTDADSNVYQLPTFLGNHDIGRIGRFVSVANPGASDEELFMRDRLAHELMYLSRGNPVIYYGDEQGFTGDGGDQLARQDMFPSMIAEYNDDDLIGTEAPTAQSNFDRKHPLYQSIAKLAGLTREHKPLCATEPTSTATQPMGRASMPSRASASTARSTWSRLTTPSRPRRRRSRPSRTGAACSSTSTAMARNFCSRTATAACR